EAEILRGPVDNAVGVPGFSLDERKGPRFGGVMLLVAARVVGLDAQPEIVAPGPAAPRPADGGPEDFLREAIHRGAMGGTRWNAAGTVGSRGGPDDATGPRSWFGFDLGRAEPDHGYNEPSGGTVDPKRAANRPCGAGHSGRRGLRDPAAGMEHAPCFTGHR